MINKEELIDRIAKNNNTTKAATKAWVNAIFEEMRYAVVEDEVRIRNFGNFELVKKQPKKGWDLYRNTPIVIPERYQLEFHPCAKILDEVRNKKVE